MLDRERADFFRALESLKAAFGLHVVATEIPIGAEHEVRGVIDLDRHEGVRVRRRRDARTATRSRSPTSSRAQADEYREKLMDEVAENSDELMERYLEGEEISHEEIVTALKKGVDRGPIFPVTCGVATKNLGTNRLLDALVEDLPSPAMKGAVQAGDETLEPDPDRRSSRYVFKTLRRPVRRAHQPVPRLPGHDHGRQRTCTTAART